MRTRIALVVAVLAAACLLIPSGAAAGTKKVKVDNDFFSPNKISIHHGTTIKFDWVGGVKHNVTYKSGPGKPFASKSTKKKGVNFKKTFKKKGTYKLICTLHSGMKLKVKAN